MAGADPTTRASTPWRAWTVAAVVGLGLRLVFGLAYWTDKPLTRDEREYLSLSRSLAAGAGFTYEAEARQGGIEPFGRAPGYPAFLAIVGGGAPPPSTSVPTAVKVAQAIVGAAGVLMIGVLTLGVAGPRASALAAALAAVYPPLVWVSSYALSEALFWPIGLFTAWTYTRATRARGRPLGAFLTGLVLGCGTLVRPGVVLFLPVAFLALAVTRRLGLFAALTIGTLVVVSPWTLRNYHHYGRVIFVASEGGITFWTGNHPLAIGDGDLAANIPIKLDDARFRAVHPGLTEEEREPLYYREAVGWIISHPTQWIALEFRKLFYLVVPIGPSYTLHSTRYYALSVASYLSVLSLALVGLVRTRPLSGAAGLWVLTGSAIVGALVFFPQERFRIPIIDPALIVLAGAGLATLWPGARRA